MVTSSAHSRLPSFLAISAGCACEPCFGPCSVPVPPPPATLSTCCMLELSSAERKGVLRARRCLIPWPQPHGDPGPACPSSLTSVFVPGQRGGTEARRALLCSSACCHSCWAQRAGTSGAWAGRPLQRCLWLTFQHGAALFVPGEAGAVPQHLAPAVICSQ